MKCATKRLQAIIHVHILISKTWDQQVLNSPKRKKKIIINVVAISDDLKLVLLLYVFYSNWNIGYYSLFADVQKPITPQNDQINVFLLFK